MSLYALTGGGAPSRELVPASPNAVVLHGIAGELAQVRDLSRNGQARFDLVTKNKGAFIASSRLQRLARWIDKNQLTEDVGVRPPIVTLGLFAGAAAGVGSFFLLGGLATGVVSVEVLMAAVGIGSGVAAVGSGVLPAAIQTKKAAAKERERAADNLVPLQGPVAAMIERYKEAGPGEKAVLGQLLQSWLEKMRSAKALEPETRAALQRVDDEVKAMPAEHQQRARHLTELAHLIDGDGSVTTSTVRSIRNHIEDLPLSERHDLAAAVADILKKSGRTIDYEAKHDLFDMVEKFETPPSNQ